jgi:hypothetical protein
MSEQTDAVQEKELKELGLMYPRVTKEQIDNLMNQVEYHTCVYFRYNHYHCYCYFTYWY